MVLLPEELVWRFLLGRETVVQEEVSMSLRVSNESMECASSWQIYIGERGSRGGS